ncbi:flavin monoamine oxidase family protein [Effusibacillus consociatus]|uniref:Flavin monoamine oxidase family protein n=1 Tax=Effusibacillus consociatus TaxID=1117041 RepID=A0ABV9Q333_9BACL
MRIPEYHYLVFEYIHKFGLQIHPFINETPEEVIYVNGVKTRARIYHRQPDILQYPVAPHEAWKTAKHLFNLAVKPIVDFINKDPIRNWSLVVKRFDKYSMYTFLKFYPHEFGTPFSEGAIEMMAVLLDLEGLMEESFLDILRINMPLVQTRFYQITGGNARLPEAFLPQVQEDIVFQQRMSKIVQYKNGVTIHSIHQSTLEPYSVTGDFAIVTIPFTVLRFVEVEPRDSFSHNKWKAIREMNFAISTKIAIEFKSRFWEREGLMGGKTVTDLPIRFTYAALGGNSISLKRFFCKREPKVSDSTVF